MIRRRIGSGDDQTLTQEPPVEQAGQGRVLLWSGGFDQVDQIGVGFPASPSKRKMARRDGHIAVDVVPHYLRGRALTALRIGSASRLPTGAPG